jgi:phosphoserine phosphatase
LHRTWLRHVLTAWLACVAIVPLAAAEPLASWNHSATRQRIVTFVTAVSTRGGPDFVPESQRIAVFDNDGTLWSERPFYFQLQYSIHRTHQLVDKHPEWRQQQPFQAALTNDIATLTAGDGKLFTQLTEATLGGTSITDFHAAVNRWLATSRHPRFKRPYTDLVFQPMLELLAYLKANRFRTYIVSGGDLEFMRAWATRVYGIPPEQIIGSRMKTRLVRKNGKPVFERLTEIEFFNNAAGKPVSIRRAIGRRPIAAFGNSDGDLHMLSWTTSGTGRRLAAIIRHTDAQREWAYDRKSPIGRLDRGLDKAAADDWLVVDMKRDWRIVYPFELTK